MKARSILGPNKIIGLSIESLSELAIANASDSIDYVTASAVFPTQTKPDCKTLWGIDGLEQVVLRSKHPVTAIGGINVQNVRSVMEQGVEGVAVIGALRQC